ncbi:MAG: hypothetical protein J7639_06565 [Paenibacillaceae bacterium]|nr:hypothetical protein [Paenibacillaceae bacterium]
MQERSYAKGASAVALALVAVLAAACSNDGGSQASTASKAPAQSAAKSAAPTTEAPIAISIANQYPPDRDDSPAQKILEQKYNIKITNVRLDATKWMEQLNLKFAAGEVPDLFLLTDSVEKYAKQGIIGEIPEKLVREKMADWSKELDKKNPMILQNAKVDNKLYMIPKFNIEGEVAFPLAYNGAWMQKAGVASAPTTLDEMEALLTKFRNDDPDGNGKKDTYGMSTSVNGGNVSGSSFASVFGAFGVFPFDWNEDKNGNLALGMTTENARQAFKVLNKWFKAGLIDPEYITTDTAKWRNNFIDGKYGAVEDIWYAFVPNGVYGKAFAAKNVPIVYGKPLSGPNGPGVGYAWSTVVINNGYAISAQAAKDPKKLNKILEMLNGLVTDDDVYLTTWFGVKGEHWDMVNNFPTQKPDWTDFYKRAKEVGTGSLSLMRNNSFALLKYYRPAEEMQFREKVTGGIKPLANKLTFIVPAQTEFPNLTAMQSQYFIKFISGEIDTDAGFDKFVEQWNNAGGKKLTEQANEKYKMLKAAK